jgi:predicted DNA-binding ribbon-helix-helix protein
MNSLVVKRLINVYHHKTSVSLEDAFWAALREIAQGRGETFSQLVGSIDANRQTANLSSAIRMYVLWYYVDKYARQQAMFERLSKPVDQASETKRQGLKASLPRAPQRVQ